MSRNGQKELTLRLVVISNEQAEQFARIGPKNDHDRPLLAGCGHINLICGKCSKLLAFDLEPGSVCNIAFACKRCRVWNAVCHMEDLERVREEIDLKAQEGRKMLLELKEAVQVALDAPEGSSEAMDRLMKIIEKISETTPAFKRLILLAPNILAFLTVLLPFLTQLEKSKKQSPAPAVIINNYSPREIKSASPAKRPKPKTGRNAPCPCGSGTKFKECHGK